MDNTIEVQRQAEEMRRAGERWREIMRVSDLSVGVYRLATGADDTQAPHTEDEVYYVLAGRGVLRIGESEHPVGPGSLAYVPARAEHRFHDITGDLELLVFFAPAEGARA
jgi:mannose-6-phosphate isomerase-like protein (cupin superfamily)